jgi:hypothetical protein
MPKAVRVAGTAALVTAALAIASCGDTVIDDGKAEDAVKADVEKSLQVKVTSVDCPADVKVEAGKTFDCVVTAGNGKKAKATLKIINSDADVNFIDLQPVK